MVKKKNNLVSIIPSFCLMGAAVGVQTKNIVTHTLIGLIIGLIVYFFLINRNKRINKTKS